MFTTVDQVKTIIANFLNKTGRGGFITGTVSSVSPLKIRINARLEITEENLYISDNCIGLSLNFETLVRSPLAVGDGVLLITRPSTIDGTKYILFDKIQPFINNKNSIILNNLENGGIINGDLTISGEANINGINISKCDYLPTGDGSLTYWQSIKQGKYYYNVNVGPVTGIPEGYGVVEVSKSTSDGIVLFYRSRTDNIYRLDYTSTVLVNWRPMSIKKILWSGEQSSGQFLMNDDIRKYKMLLIHQKSAGADIPVAFTGQGLYVSGCSAYCSPNVSNALLIYQVGFGIQTFYGGTGNQTLLNFYASNYWNMDSSATSKEISKSVVIPIQYIYGVC